MTLVSFKDCGLLEWNATSSPGLASPIEQEGMIFSSRPKIARLARLLMDSALGTASERTITAKRYRKLSMVERVGTSKISHQVSRDCP